MPKLQPKDLFFMSAATHTADMMDEMERFGNRDKVGFLSVDNYIDDWTPLLSKAECKSKQRHIDEFTSTYGSDPSEFPNVVLQISQSEEHALASPDSGLPCYTNCSSKRWWIASLNRWQCAGEKAHRQDSIQMKNANELTARAKSIGKHTCAYIYR